MAATVVIYENNGAGQAQTDKTGGTIRFKNADNATVDLADPMTVPDAGTDYSFEKYLSLEVTGGSFSQLTNFEAYSDGAGGLGTGVDVRYATAAAYAAPTEASGPGTGSLFAKTAGDPIGLGAGPVTAAPARLGDFLKLWMTVADTAAAGVTPSETLTFAYDEI